jgi:hypothetical protein
LWKKRFRRGYAAESQVKTKQSPHRDIIMPAAHTRSETLISSLFAANTTRDLTGVYRGDTFARPLAGNIKTNRGQLFINVAKRA